MQITVSARHCELTEELRERAEAIGERLAGLAARPMDAIVLFDMEAGAPTAEIHFRVAHEELIVAVGDGPDHRSALDRAEEKIRRQLDKPAVRRRKPRKSKEVDQV
jgi:ribosome-associated translation inhibitor RaiA